MKDLLLFLFAAFLIAGAGALIGLCFRRSRSFSLKLFGLSAVGAICVVGVAAETDGKDRSDTEPQKPSASTTLNLLGIPRPSTQPGLNPAWSSDNYDKRLIQTAVRSASGYPIVAANKEWVVCANAFVVQEASDAMVAGRKEWASGIPGCVIIPEGLEAEWTKYAAITGVSEFRFELPGRGRPITMYGKQISSYVGDWAYPLKQ